MHEQAGKQSPEAIPGRNHSLEGTSITNLCIRRRRRECEKDDDDNDNDDDDDDNDESKRN